MANGSSLRLDVLAPTIGADDQLAPPVQPRKLHSIDADTEAPTTAVLEVERLRAGQALGHYELLLPLSGSGTSQLWSARLCGSSGIDEVVTIKTIPRRLLVSSGSEEALREEARLAASIVHRNVVRSVGLGDEGPNFYLVREWVNGESLGELQHISASSGGIPRALAVNIVLQICDGLHAAHEVQNNEGQSLGIVHGDISPSNVMLSHDGTAKLLDFGFAKATLAAALFTQNGMLGGQVAYMSPEQFGSQPVDCRADIFSVGALLYRLTTGRHPFRGDTVEQTLHQLRHEAPLPPSTLVRGYPWALESVLLKSLAKDPALRWQTAREMREALATAEPDAAGPDAEAHLADFLNAKLGHQAHERLRTLQDAVAIGDGAKKNNERPPATSPLSVEEPVPVSGVRDVSTNRVQGPPRTALASEAIAPAFTRKSPTLGELLASAFGDLSRRQLIGVALGLCMVSGIVSALLAGWLSDDAALARSDATHGSALARSSSEPTSLSAPAKTTDAEPSVPATKPLAAPGAPSPSAGDQRRSQRATSAATPRPTKKRVKTTRDSAQPAASIDPWDTRFFGGRN